MRHIGDLPARARASSACYEPRFEIFVVVSVLMPARNAAPYVREAVLSVLGQAGPDLELLVIDDRSTDDTRAIVRSIRDPRLRVLDGPGRGPAAAWNVGFAVSRGDVVAQCDADDLFPPDRLRAQTDFLAAHDEYGAICGGFSSMGPTGRHVADLWPPRAVAEEITDELRSGTTRTSLCTFTIRRSVLVAAGGKREYFESAEDIDLQLLVAERCRVWWDPSRTYRYRLHDASLTHRQASARRRFFEQYARDLRAQRARGEPDDLQRGSARPPPPPDSPPDSTEAQIQGMLLGEAWRRHGGGDRLGAIGLGLRALSRSPASPAAWKSLAALLIKPPWAGS